MSVDFTHAKLLKMDCIGKEYYCEKELYSSELYIFSYNSLNDCPTRLISL